MKTTLFNLIMLISISYNSLAQDFAPVGAKWYFNEDYAWSNNIGFITYESIGDTIINNLSCRIIYKDKSSCCIPGGNHFLHQSNDSIFLYNPTTETFDLIIDFSAEIGDSWILNTNPDGYLFSDSVTCLVDSISFFYYSASDSLKILHVTLESPEYFISYFGDTIYYIATYEIIQKIGFRSAILLKDCIRFCDGNFDGNIRCYEDFEVGLITFSSVDCDYTPIENVNFNDEISTYPNPAREKIFIEAPDLKLDNITLYSLEGSQILIPINNNEVDVSSLDMGIYFLRIQTKKGISTKKIIVLK